MTIKQFRTEKKRKVNLTRLEKKAILEIDQNFKSIKSSFYFDNYDLPCPIKVDILTKDKIIKSVVLRRARHGDIKKEIAIMEVLRNLNFPTPEVLHKPFTNEKKETLAVYSLLPGINLQKISMESKEGIQKAKFLLIEAVTRLMRATLEVEQHKISKSLPSYTLESEMKKLKISSSPWNNEKIFQDALNKISLIVKKIKTPLTLTNGDYQPGNFLSEKGEITGFLDFESPSFQDPLMGFVKYPIYDLFPLSRTNLVELFLKKNDFSKEDFNIRLCIGCLKILTKEISVSGGDNEMQNYRDRVLKLLNKSLKKIK